MIRKNAASGLLCCLEMASGCLLTVTAGPLAYVLGFLTDVFLAVAEFGLGLVRGKR